MDNTIEGVLLLGGRSTRFGSDKMTAVLGQGPLYHATYGALSGVCSRIHLSLAHPDAVSVPPPDVPGCTWGVVADVVADRGPLGGIHAVMRERKADLLVVAGDLPAIRPDSLARLLRMASESDAALVGASARASRRKQPLCGLWRSVLLEELASYLAAGGRSVFGFVDQIPAEWVDLEDADLTNINRPGDLDLLTRMS